jgi:PEP-CTERM motif
MIAMRNSMLVATVLLFGTGTACADLTVNKGFDLFMTNPAETVFTFMGQAVHLEGVPLGSYDFGGTVGVQGTYLTDTIVQPLDDATVAAVGDTATIPIELVALQLMSQTPVDIGGGDFHTLFVTLSDMSPTGGPAGAGTMDITFNSSTATTQGGTFDSFFDIFFDVHVDSLNGQVIASDQELQLNGQDTWVNTAPPNAWLIDGANNNLNGSTNLNDFWPGPGLHNGPHGVDPTTTPEPSTLLIAGAGVLALLGHRWLASRGNAV